MIDLRKPPSQSYSYISRYGIGDTVWHATGVYSIPMSFRILSVKFQYDRYGNLITYYSHDSGPSTYWYEEIDLFPTEQECLNSL